MALKWGKGRWNAFKWGQSDAFETLLDDKSKVEPKFRLIWELDAGDQDITQYYISGASFAQEKERPPSRLTAGDTSIIFDNSSGVFTEMNTSSFLYGVTYHNRRISFELGVTLPDGSIEYFKVATMIVSDVDLSSDNNVITLQLYDALVFLLTAPINKIPSALATPTYGGGNTGNGTISSIATKPFVNVTQNWTLTCTTPGGSGVALFSVVGSVSGNIGTATDGTEFFNATSGGIRFTISAGTLDWVGGDTILFSTSKTMEWTTANPVKIIWSLLTGYNWDTDVVDPWSARTPLLDHTQNSTNTDLDYAGFANAVDQADAYFSLTGFIPWDYKLSDAIEEINALMLGACPVDPKGRISIKIFRPEFFPDPREFADTKKNTKFKYARDTRNVINSMTVKYRKTTNFPWSDDDQEATLDGVYTASNAASITALGHSYEPQSPMSTRWYSNDAGHVVYMATRILDKYGRVPRMFTIVTGIDGIEQQVGDIINATDEKLVLDNYPLEVMRREILPDQVPIKVQLTAEDTGTIGITWAFLGSTADEGDGLSPQATDFDSASVTDKYFCYLGTTSVETAPAYYLF